MRILSIALTAVFTAALAGNVRAEAPAVKSRNPAKGSVTNFTPLKGQRTQIINLSLPKTGTVSIASIFSRLGSAHEFMREESVQKLRDWQRGELPVAKLDAFLIQRDKALVKQLDSSNARGPVYVDSATFLFLAQDRFFELFPDAKYMAVIRDGEPWLVSLVDTLVFISDPEVRKKLNIKRTGDNFLTPGLKMSIFNDPKNLGKNIRPVLPDLAAFWGKWTLGTLNNLRKLPKEQRLIIRTQEISYSLDKMAAFAGVPVTALDQQNTHLNKDRKQHDILKLIGKTEIQEAFGPWQRKVDALMKEIAAE